MAIDIPDFSDVVRSDWRALYEQSLQNMRRLDEVFPPEPYVAPSRWQRLRWWVRDHTPHVHLGPCDHSECGW